MTPRQQIVLSLVSRAGGSVTRLQLMKWAFLFTNEYQSCKQTDFYQFVPYLFGPFSFTLYNDLDKLMRDGLLLVNAENDIELAGTDRSLQWPSDPGAVRDLDRMWMTYGSWPTSQLLDVVYTRYPWFTLNSKLRNKRVAALPLADPAVYSIGFGGHQVDGFLNLLLLSGVAVLIDVRSNPVSRRYGFHKNTLQSICHRVGIAYYHVPEVGVPSDWRTDLRDLSDYACLFSRYEAEILTEQMDAVERICSLMRSAPAALACQEADPLFCHRTRLAAHVSRILGLPIRDLGAVNGRGF